ncbi:MULTISPECIES: methyltransferase domain-containing protein [unclassified Microcoleus]|uniref:methyltransferase domain-containing protein n=1 Tax=unclassified Microcoleus TaxID=2642155 RepID=UPI002FCFC3B7
MAVGKDTIFERFLSPLVRLAIDEEALKRLYEGIDWETAGDRYRQPDLVYPEYYTSQNFHGIKRGYLNPSAAVSYDPITQYVLPPHETVVRQGLIDAVRVKPRRIIDLGCGTGSTTLMLKQAFPEAEVVGLDLSPYMLVVADMKAQKAGLNIQWLHGNAESVAFPDASFDLVAASLLFHETPPAVSRAILRESFRLLKVGGQVAILDGNQKTLRQTEWLTDIFEEPYIKSYAAGSLDAWAGAAGFAAVQTHEHWWVNQVTQGVKPLPGEDLEQAKVARGWNWGDQTPDFDGDLPGIPAPA